MPPHPSSHIPAPSSRFYQPYFSHAEIEFLSEKQRGKQSATQEERNRQSACTFLEAIGARIGFPRRTIATAQAIYHRFHLFYPAKNPQKDFDTTLAALYVSAKENDTLKKPRELLAAAYTIRRPEASAKSKNPMGDIDLDTMNPQEVENDRQKLLTVERLMLETMCFNFAARMPFPYVIKIGKKMNASKKCIKFAWRIAIDSFRTLLPLIYPPHTLAVGCIYVAALLLSYDKPEGPEKDADGNWSESVIARRLSTHSGDWQREYRTKVSDCEDIAHTVLDLFIQFTQIQSTNASPSTPSSPSPNLPIREKYNLHALQLQHPFKPDQLIQIKITLRERESENHPIRKRKRVKASAEKSTQYSNENIGQNEGTVRFMFFPPGAIAITEKKAC
ncbi:hypothetical protein CPC08DRAFT_629403 [Agrocybe pediades]|nr:hypothetical protein CPC08DRAFT_629403 [Agrocybe pediades]